MTIKPVVSQKSNEKKDSHGHGQDAQSSSIRPNHRNILVNKSSSESQSPQRRSDIFDDVSRHRRSPHKSSCSIRSKRDHHKREPRDIHCPSPQCHQAHSSHASSSCVPSKSPKHPPHAALIGASQPQGSKQNDLHGVLEEAYSGYNSGDEHLVPKETLLTPEEWKHRDEQFIKAMSERGFIIQDIVEDGACLFRAISLQIYGDQEMHEEIRQQTMDYIYQNREYFAHFVTEDINSYVKRKRNKESHGNHIEIQAMSEIYNRPVELYCYQTTPTNIFNSEQINNGYDPLRLSYQRGSHYNAIIDPYNASVGVGLGLANYKPESQTREAIRLSEQLEIEQTMFEDKLKTTDWEATTEVIEEQIARESYLQWCRENLPGAKVTTTVTQSTSTASSSANSSTLCSTITSASVKASHVESCSGSNAKDAPQYHVGELTGSVSSDPVIISASELLCKEIELPKGNECYDSDDTDRSSTSSTADVYKDTNKQLGHLKYKLPAKRSLMSSGGSVRRNKRRRRESADEKNGSCECTNTEQCSHMRLKQLKACSSMIPEQIPASTTGSEVNHLSMLQQSRNNPKELSIDYGELPCTSKQAAQTGKPLSSFYRALLESSYADNGFGQMSESEMIVKAIRLSRIDFYEKVKQQRHQVINDNPFEIQSHQCGAAVEENAIDDGCSNSSSPNNMAKLKNSFDNSVGSRLEHDDDSDSTSV